MSVIKEHAKRLRALILIFWKGDSDSDSIPGQYMTTLHLSITWLEATHGHAENHGAFRRLDAAVEPYSVLGFPVLSHE